jgi:hypothetical protein
MLLHFIPRFQKLPRSTGYVLQITGKAPRTLPVIDPASQINISSARLLIAKIAGH